MVEETKFKIGSEWRRRDGLKATVLDNAFLLTNTDIGLCVKIKSPANKFEDVDMLFSNGTAFIDKVESPRDLIELDPVKVDGWVIVYSGGEGNYSEIYSKKEYAQKYFSTCLRDHDSGDLLIKPIAIVHVTGEEGKE